MKNTAIGQLQMAARGMTLLKMNLRSRSKQIQRVLKTIIPFSEMRTRIPQELLGVELLDVLGPVLRSLLSVESNQIHRLTRSYRVTPDQHPEDIAMHFKDIFSSLIRPPGNKTSTSSTQSSVFSGQRSSKENPLENPVRSQTMASDQMRILNQDRIVQADSPQHQQPQTTISALQNLRVPSLVHSPQIVTLHETVSRYWNSQNQSNQISPGSDHQKYSTFSPNRPIPTLSQDPGIRPQRWEEIAGRSAANQILHSINADPGQLASRTEQNLQIGQDERRAVRNVFHIHVPAGANSNLRIREDLSNSLAGLLREQAIDHGIDVP